VPWRPLSAGDFPTLGWHFLDWTRAYLARPESQLYEPFTATQEQADFALEYYRLDPRTARRRRRRGMLSRPRGWGKSPFCAAFAAFEALGPAVPDGWDANGQPVGMPWSQIRRPLVEIAAVSESQVDTNTWAPLIDMLSHDLVINEFPGLEPMGTFVNLPYGKIQKRTAEARSAKGAPAHFVVCDQTEEWTSSNGGRSLFDTLRNNVIKRGGHLLESPNAYIPADGAAKSVAQSSMEAFQEALSGRRPKLDDGIYVDHREAPPETDMEDAASLMRGLAVAYGDSADIAKCVIHKPACRRPGWVDLGHIAASIWELDADPQLSRADWLNQITHASDSWIDQPTWAARYAFRDDAEVEVDQIADDDLVTLGFDGSRGRAKGKPDATALIGCRVGDGHVFEVGVWEAPDGESGKGWTPPISVIEAAIKQCFSLYRVAAFYCDPAKDWRSYVNAWEAKYAEKLVPTLDGKRLTVTRDHPFEWWMTGGRSGLIERAIEQLEGAIRNGDMTHDGSYALTRHVLSARRKYRAGKLAIGKEHDYSPNKIDAAVAAVLAWQARLDAIAAGVGQTRRKSKRIHRF
jgi:hypothetical protein